MRMTTKMKDKLEFDMSNYIKLAENKPANVAMTETAKVNELEKVSHVSLKSGGR